MVGWKVPALVGWVAVSSFACAGGSNHVAAGAGGAGSSDGGGGAGAGGGGASASSSSGQPCESGPCTCAEGATKACYDGPNGTEGVGPCRAGKQTCDAGAWGRCEGEVVPAGNQCIVDECDGQGCPGGAGVRARKMHGSAASVATDAYGNVFVTGTFRGTIDLGCGPLTTSASPGDGYIAKLSPSLTCVWSLPIRATDGVYPEAVAVDGDGAPFVSGTFSGTSAFGEPRTATWDAFLIKFDPYGEGEIWSHPIVGDDELQAASSVAVDASGNVFIAGLLWGPTDFGEGTVLSVDGERPFLAKLDPAGHVLWAHAYPSVSGAAGSVAVDATTGHVALSGPFAQTIDFGGTPVTTGTNGSFFVAVFDGSGAPLWSKGFGASFLSSKSRELSFDRLGNLIIGGQFLEHADFGGGALTASAGHANAFVAKFDPGGAHLWSKRFGDGEGDIRALATDHAGDIVLLGNFGGALDLGGAPLAATSTSSVFVAKLGGDGAHVWSKTYADPMPAYGAGLALDGAGHAFVTGSFDGSIDFGTGPLTSSGGEYFLAEIAE